MMKINILTFLLILVINTGCNDNSENQSTQDTPEIIQNQTPEVLNDKTDYGLRSISKKKNYDIILRLYNEALEKNAKLNQLNEKIVNMYDYQRDSLTDYTKYDRTNNSYWMSVQSYIRSIKDSVLRESTQEKFDSIEMNYRSKMSPFEQTLDVINEKSISLHDQLVLMKLFVTAPMIKNYQTNELPNIQTLENIIDEYDQLIKKSEEFTKINE